MHLVQTTYADLNLSTSLCSSEERARGGTKTDGGAAAQTRSHGLFPCFGLGTRLAEVINGTGGNLLVGARSPYFELFYFGPSKLA